MATFKCKMCGGQLEVQEGQSVCTCEFCGTAQTVPHFDNEKKATFFKRAHDLRFKCEFDKAAGVYETIVTEYPNEAEAYWGLVLCKYGIEYVDDPKTKKKIPTCHRTQFASIFDDHDYLSAIRCADAVARELYKREANAISKLQNAILEISSKEDPFDVFICYKETDDRGGRTPDSVLAQDIFDELSSAGYKVFFARRTLERKLGSEYEPYIFAALHSAKVMVHVTSSKANSEAVWVRNEWSRYLSLIAEGQKKTLIPCYKGISAYELPDEMKNLQGQDMSKLGAMQDLIYGIKKILKPTGRVVEKVAEDAPVSSDTGYDALVRKGHTYLKNHKMEQAKRCFEKAIEAAELCGDAYLGMLLCEYQLESLEELLTQSDLDILASENFNLAREFANKSCNETLNQVEEAINRNKKLEKYNQAKFSLEAGRYDTAIEQFQELGDFENSEEMILECVYQKGQMYFGYISSIKNIGYCDDAINCFNEVVKYKDSKEMIDKVNSLKANIVAEYKTSCIAKYEIELPKEVTLVALNELVKKVKANRDRVFTPNYDEFDDARANVETGVIKFFVEKTPALIQSLTALDECSKFRGLCSSIEKDGNLKAVYPLIKQRESEIKEQLAVLKKKKRKKTLTITGIISGVLAVAVASFFGIKAIVDETNRSNTYNTATSYMESGNYDDAIAYYETLGNYKESQSKIQVCNGLKQLESSITTKKEEDAIKGIKVIVSAGEKVDVSYETENNVNIKRLASSGNSGNKVETIETIGFTFYQPSWSGYTFTNWNSNSLSYSSGRTYLGLMSNWSLNSYSITYNLNGGTNSSNNPSIFTVESPDIILQSASKDGYTFDGWFDNNNNRVEKISHGTFENVILNANWVANDYIITLEPNGGNVAQTTINVKYDSEFNLPTPTRDYYGFTGWYDSNNNKWFDGKYQTANNVTLTARWSAYTYSITYVLNGGTNNANNPTSYTVEDAVSLYNPTRMGYGFTGWYDESDNKVSGISVGSHGDRTFTAHWNINTYIVTFKNYDGTVLDTQTVEHGSSVTYGGATPTRLATVQYTYSWTGWDKSLTNITSDTTITATYSSTVNKYTITWKNYDGTTLKTDSVAYGSTPSYSGATPTKPSDDYYTYTFSGWSPTITAVTGAKTYTAQFISNAKYIYSVSGDNATIIGIGQKNLAKYEIPSTINGYKVTEIAAYAFNGCNLTEEVYVPDSVTHIERGAFYSMSSIKKITLPFVGSGNRSYKNEPNGLGAMFGHIFGSEEFENTQGSYWTFTGESGYVYVPLSLETVVIERPNSAPGATGGSVVPMCFQHCTMIKNITLGDNVDGVGWSAFKGCVGLQTVTMKNVEEICYEAFYGCDNLTAINWGDSLTTIGSRAFGKCLSLASVTLPDSLEQISDAFLGCPAMEEMSLPFVGNGNGSLLFGNIFGYDSSLKTTLFNQRKQRTTASGCQNSSGGIDVSIPKSLTKITIRNDVNTAFAFNGIPVNEINLPAVHTLEQYAFYGSSVQTVSMPEATNISTYAFCHTGQIRNVTCPNVTNIGTYAFDYSSILYYDRCFIAKTKVEYLGQYSFCHAGGNTEITYIVLPATLIQIGTLTFGAGNGGGFDNLETFYFEGTPDQWSAIDKASMWSYYSSVMVRYYSSTYQSGRWHYVDGVPTLW